MRPPLRTDLASIVAIGAGTLVSFAFGGVMLARGHSNHEYDRDRMVEVERMVYEAEHMGQAADEMAHAAEHMEHAHVHASAEGGDMGDLSVHRDATGLYIEHQHDGPVHRHYVGEAEMDNDVHAGSSSEFEVILSGAEGDHSRRK